MVLMEDELWALRKANEALAKRGKAPSEGQPTDAKPATQPRCSGCGKVSRSIPTCQAVEEPLEEGSCIECS